MSGATPARRSSTTTCNGLFAVTQSTSTTSPTEAVPAASEASGAAAPSRLVGLDRLRGLAVLLMVLDHVLLVVGEGLALRLTVTRAALPIFGLLAGALWRPGARVRLLQLGGAAIVATYLGVVLGMPRPDVLVVIFVALLAMHAYRRWPVATFAVAAIQATTWGIAAGGYEPGVLLVLMVGGYEFGRERLDVLGRRAPALLELLGRYPLSLYLGHLALLALAVSL